MGRSGGSYYSKYNDTELTDKQIVFVDEYLKCFNVTEAAKKAGYNSNVANLKKSKTIQKEIAKRMEEIRNENIASQQEVLEILTSFARGEKQDYSNEKVKKVNDVVEKQEIEGNKTPSEDSRLRAVEMLGKAYALFTDKKQIDANIESVTFVDDIEDE